MGNKVASMEWFVFMALTGLWLAKTIRLSAQSASHSGKNEGDKDEELVVLELSVAPVWPCRVDLRLTDLAEYILKHPLGPRDLEIARHGVVEHTCDSETVPSL